ncbi:MAG TPA: DUF805 domain-containing protein [Caulobacteraceae bacterium]|nr:DUF805 domain-containing protein [Caulobacteraceae bacterium]
MNYDWKRLFLSADGRIGRQEYWIGFLILLGVSVVVKFIPFLGLILTLALIYPQVCVGSKRLHDFGKSGFLMLAPYGAFVAGIILAMIMGGAAIMSSMTGRGDVAAAGVFGAAMGAGMVMLLVGLLCLAFIIWVGVMQGDPAENRYGPPPLAEPAVVPPSPPAA